SGKVQPVLRYLRTAVPMWVGTIFVVAGSIASIASVGEWRAARRFDRDSVAAQAAVVDTSLEGASRDGNESTRYLVTYRFTPLNGAEVEQTEEIPLETWEALAAGDSVPVRYLPDDPGAARTYSATPAWVPLLVAALAAAVAALARARARAEKRRGGAGDRHRRRAHGRNRQSRAAMAPPIRVSRRPRRAPRRRERRPEAVRGRRVADGRPRHRPLRPRSRGGQRVARQGMSVQSLERGNVLAH